MDTFQFFVASMSFLLLIVAPELQLIASNKPTSFSLKLIHRDSPESPLYPGNLSFHERVQRYMKISESRASYLMSITTHNKTIYPEMMHPYVLTTGFTYLVALEIGTPRNQLFLVLDTGSELIWTQCRPCEPCFQQKGEIFDPRKSRSYEKVPCDHPNCEFFECSDGECCYDVHYLDGSSTKGVASWETFIFRPSDGKETYVKNVLFGCSNSNQGFRSSKAMNMAGILGMSLSPISLISQLGDFVEKRFSYCLVLQLQDGSFPVSYLKFGTDMGYKGPTTQTTPFVKHPNSYHYGLNLLDISVSDMRMKFPPGTFKVKKDGVGGFIIDSGSVVTYLQTNVYRKMHNQFVRFFSAVGIERRLKCPRPIKLCYSMPSEDYNKFIPITFHFQGANLTIEPENLFIIHRKDKFFMLALAPQAEKNILGTWQQRNTRFVYDLNTKLLWFVPENCAKDQG